MKQMLLLPALLFGMANAGAQFTITGTVRDQAGKPLTGASVFIKDTYLGTTTGQQGFFRLGILKSDEYLLMVSFLGYETESVLIHLKGNFHVEMVMKESVIIGEEIVVSAIRASQQTPATFSLLSEKQLSRNNLGKDLPYLVAHEPSVVTTSDAGNGIGYTGIRIRGSDMTRINVTLNGIPVNDPESHNVFWVDLPDLASSVNSIQIQRGVGSSTNGAGAFGASLNIDTKAFQSDPYGQVNASFGSYNTWKNTVKLGTGLINNHWYFDGRASLISSDGYIDRAGANLRSFFLQGGYAGEKTLLKAIVMSGTEKTYQAWYGVDARTMDTARTFNWAGAIFDEDGAIRFYDNQVDHYRQDYYQLHYSRQLSNSFYMNLAGHYTRGRGYYEEYMQDQPFEPYGMQEMLFGRDSVLADDTYVYYYHDTVNNTDLVRRRWLDNHFYGITYAARYRSPVFDLTLGGAVNKYDNARHFGELLWAEYASQTGIGHVFYDNRAEKTDFNIYTKMIYRPGKRVGIYADLQYRGIYYQVAGTEMAGLPVNLNEKFHFFNPKAGVTLLLPGLGTLYASYSVANREPVRDDFIDAPQGENPEHETLYNLEAGIRKNARQWYVSGNLFLMNYRNQLVLTGEINDDGAYIRSNTGRSYRLGLELTGSVKPGTRISIDGNIAVSHNRTDYMHPGDQGEPATCTNTPISFSPWLVGFLQLNFKPLNQLEISANGKFVSRQFLDNTHNPDLSLDGYVINDFRMEYMLYPSFVQELGFVLQANNFLNRYYVSNGYVYEGNPYYYPQGGIHFQAGVSLTF